MRTYIRSDGKELSIPESLSEITFKDFIPFLNHWTDFEKRVKKFYDLKDGEWVNTPEVLFVDFKEDIIWQVQYFAKCEDIIDADYETVKELYYRLLQNLFPKPKELTDFIYKENKYIIPKSKTSLQNILFPLAEATFGQVTEALQLERLQKAVSSQNWLVIPQQLAILTLPKCNTQEEINKRAELFQDIPMNICYDFAFFLMNLKLSYYGNSLSFLNQKIKEGRLIKNNIN